MPSGPVKATQRRSKDRPSTEEGLRALIALAVLAGILLLAIFVTSASYFSSDQQTHRAESKIAPLSQSNGGEAAHRVASIVVETNSKGRCEERRFDNRTGKVVSSNYVDCDARLAAERDTTPPENNSAERMRAIHGAFKR